MGKQEYGYGYGPWEHPMWYDIPEIPPVPVADHEPRHTRIGVANRWPAYRIEVDLVSLDDLWEMAEDIQ